MSFRDRPRTIRAEREIHGYKWSPPPPEFREIVPRASRQKCALIRGLFMTPNNSFRKWLHLYWGEIETPFMTSITSVQAAIAATAVSAAVTNTPIACRMINAWSYKAPSQRGPGSLRPKMISPARVEGNISNLGKRRHTSLMKLSGRRPRQDTDDAICRNCSCGKLRRSFSLWPSSFVPTIARFVTTTTRPCCNRPGCLRPATLCWKSSS